MRKTLHRLSTVVTLAVAGFALSGTALAVPQSQGTTAETRTPTSVYGPYASYEVCWVAGNQGQQAGQWQSYFCAQNGTTSWWLFTTP